MLAATVSSIARSGFDVASVATFTVLMVGAAGSDVRHRRIPNGLVLAIVALGALFAIASVGPRDAAILVLEGSGAGFLMWLPFWGLGMIGAGDVKFFASSCAWLGPRLALNAALASALLGGALAIAWFVRRAGARRATVSNIGGIGISEQVEREESGGGGRGAKRHDVTLPYGVAMAAGLAITAWFPHLIQ